jgi:large subunit ribosomal protein L27
MGKDHTIFATETGYVRYYQDPNLHPKRRYIGVALEREGKLAVLPTPKNAATRRRLGMYAAPIKGDASAAFLESHLSANSSGAPKALPTPTSNKGVTSVPAAPVMRQGTYMQREANFEIGRAAEKKGITVREYDRGDRWLAWRKRAQKVKKAALARAAKASRKTKGKKMNKAAQGGPGRRR